jgi:hypothetical protein
MRSWIAFVTAAVVAVTAAACGKSEQQKAAEAAAKQLEEAARSAESGDTAKSLEEMGKALGALAGGATGSKPTEPVSFKELQVAFPDFDGWEKGKPTGEKMSSPVSYSQATVRYRKGDAEITAKLVDSGFNPLLIAPLSMFLSAGYEKETEDGYEKATKVAGFPGFERWNSESKTGEVSAVVGKRFILTVEGDNLDDTKLLHQFAERANLRALPTK